MHAFFNLEKFKSLPQSYQQILTNACASANNNMLANYDARNATALKQLVAEGAILKPFSREIMDVCFKAAMELYADLSAKSPAFKKLYDSQQAFKKDAYLWAQVAEYSYDTYMMTQQRNGAL
jgi:TRAP-type mannitol/chloroaromatic compound transport system substrate-binding protein